MLIFIDKLGRFARPPKGETSLGCIGGLVVPESTYSLLGHRFDRLKGKWNGTGGEVKGSRLSAGF